MSEQNKETMTTSARPERPTTEPNAETLLRYLAGRGVWTATAIWGAMDKGGEEGDHLSTRLMYQSISAHDSYLLLAALRELDETRADELAAQIWRAAEAGDGYGEWLWQWADELGLDAEAISADADATMRDKGCYD